MGESLNFQFAVQEESTPGTLEAGFAASDVPVRLISDFTVSPTVEEIDLDEVTGDSSTSEVVGGFQRLEVGIGYRLRAPSALGTSTAAKLLFQSAMLLERTVKEIDYTGISGGPFTAGEEITGGTSNATGICLLDSAATEVFVMVTSGTFQDAETITGGTSGATATVSGTPTDEGQAFALTDSDFSSAGHLVSFEAIRAKRKFVGRGALSDISFGFSNGQPATVRQNFVGAWVSSSDADVGSMYDVTYSETATPPKFLDISLAIDSYSPKAIVDLDLAIPTGASIIEDAQQASGILHADYDLQANAPTVTMDVRQATIAQFDFFGKLTTKTTHNLTWNLGTTAGSRWTFVVPFAQLTDAGLGEREPNIPTFPLTWRATGAVDRKVIIWHR